MVLAYTRRHSETRHTQIYCRLLAPGAFDFVFNDLSFIE